MENKDYYKVLGVSSTATIDEIIKAFRKKNMENHPDRLGINENSEVWKIANEYIKLLNEAYRVLSDPSLRKKYDEEYNFDKPKNNSTEKTNKQSTYSENTSKKTPIIFNYEEVSSQLKNIIKRRQNKEHIHKIKTKGVIPSYIGAVILFVWFPILFSLSNSSRWKDETVFIYYAISIIVSIIIFHLIVFVIKWHKSEIKWNILVTPLYFIITEFEKITYYFLWDLKDIKATSNYKNGIYQNTSVVLYLGNSTYDISFSSENSYKEFVSSVDFLIKLAVFKQSNYDIEYFIKNDDLLNINPPPLIISKNEKVKSLIKYGIPLLLSLLVSSIFYSINKQISSAPHYIPSTPIYSSDYNYQSPERNDNYFNETELTLPRNGSVKYYTYEEAVAPLRIITRSNTNYYVKLEDYYSGRIIVSVFIRAYETINIDVPLGSYTFKYATGEKWYGDKYLFGPYTSYYKASSRFDFQLIGNQYSGYTVELFLQRDGNLRTQEISPADF